MASIYKRKNRKGKTYYAFQWFDHNGKRRASKGFSDRQLTEQAAAKKEDEVRRIKLGLIDPAEVEMAERRKIPLEDFLKEFENSLKKRSPKHLKLTMSRIRRIVKECEFETLPNIEKVSIEGCLTEMLENEEIGHRTYNHYIQAIDSFCNWCVENSRLPTNPLKGLVRLNTDVDVRHSPHRGRRWLRPEVVGRSRKDWPHYSFQFHPTAGRGKAGR
jgi:hypothetical protein